MRYLFVLAATALTAFSTTAVVTPISTSEFQWPAFEQVAVNSAAMTHITYAGDGTGRLFVVEQRGNIKILQDGRLATSACHAASRGAIVRQPKVSKR